MRLILPIALACSSLAGAAVASTDGKKPETNKQAGAGTKQRSAVAAPAAPAPLPAADEAQMQAAAATYYGPYDCEFKQTLSISKHPTDGYVVVTFATKAYTMKPVRSRTGAVRLEEVDQGPMLMVQIPAKSMLMDTVRGRRIVDACVNEIQAKEVVTDTNALGMNLPGQVNTSDLSITQSPTTRR
ncbi:MAG TPA: hypothetical protein PLB41_17310 [Rubrivivax sp.]|nr:hypothetical protein [Rubrivivax sp.]HPO19072.1 hypothetical protein [Rubrivivax sp.]